MCPRLKNNSFFAECAHQKRISQEGSIRMWGKKNHLAVTKALLSARFIDVVVDTIHAKCFLDLDRAVNNTTSGHTGRSNVYSLCKRDVLKVGSNGHVQTLRLLVAPKHNAWNLVLNECCIKRDENVDYDWALNGACTTGRANVVWNLLLIEACIKGHENVVRLAIANDAFSGPTALHWACRGGHTKIVEILITKGAEAWNQGLYGACEGGHIDLIVHMISNGATDLTYALYYAGRAGHRDAVELLVSKGACNLNLGLCGACEGAHRDIAELLISKGADNWNQALSFACEDRHVEIVQWMISNGATKCSWCSKTMTEHISNFETRL
jgi:ankyrin repeat protein